MSDIQHRANMISAELAQQIHRAKFEKYGIITLNGLGIILLITSGNILYYLTTIIIVITLLFVIRDMNAKQRTLEAKRGAILKMLEEKERYVLEREKVLDLLVADAQENDMGYSLD